MRLDGLTDSQKYLIGALVKIIKRLNRTDGGEEKAGGMLRMIIMQSTASLCSRVGQTQKVANATYVLVCDMADLKEK